MLIRNFLQYLFLLSLSPLTAITLVFGLVYLVFFPGALSVDSLDQLRQAVTEHYTDWHPPLMAYLWHLFNKVSFGPQSYFLFNVVLFLVGLSFVARGITACGKKQSIVIAGLGLYPLIFMQLSALWKDTSASMMLLIASGVLLCMETRQKSPLILHCLVCGAFIAAASFRHVGIASVAPLCFWYVNIIARANRWIRYIFPACLLCIAVLIVVQCIKAVIVSERTYPEQMIQVYDIVGIKKFGGTVLVPPSIPVIEEQNYFNRALQVYTSRTNWPLFSIWGGPTPLMTTERELHELLVVWADAIVHNIKPYLLHRMGVMYSLLNAPSVVDCCGIYTFSMENEYGFSVENTYIHSVATQFLYSFSTSIAGKGFFSTGLLVVLFLSYCFVPHMRRRADRRAILYLSSSGLMNVVILFFLSPGCDVRYLYWTFTAAVLCMILYVRSLYLSDGREISLH